MYIFQVKSNSTPPEITEVARPVPAPHEVTVRIRACALNFSDQLIATGRYQDMPTFPATLGMEFAGQIESANDAAPFDIGTRVAGFTGSGGLAEYGVFDPKYLVQIPDAMPFDHASAFIVAYGTSHIAICHKARLTRGETLVVTGAGGGAGLTAVEIGVQIGATVIAVVRGADKAAAVKAAGAHHVLDPDHDDLRTTIKDLGGADVVYDAIGGDMFTDLFRATNPDGRMLLIGFAGGNIPTLKANHMLVKNIATIGINIGYYMKERPDIMRQSLQELFSWYEDGALCPHIGARFTLEDADQAFQTLRNRTHAGKIVVEMPAP